MIGYASLSWIHAKELTKYVGTFDSSNGSDLFFLYVDQLGSITPSERDGRCQALMKHNYYKLLGFKMFKGGFRTLTADK